MTSSPPEWLLLSDIDGTLTGDDAALAELMAHLARAREHILFGVASGRSPQLVAKAVRDFGLNQPHLVIASVGSELYGPDNLGERYREHISAGWDRERIVEILVGVPGLEPQGPAGQRPFKVSFNTVEPAGEVLPTVERALAEAGLEPTLIYSHGQFLDVLPKRASKGRAVRFVSEVLGIPLSRVVVAGDSGNDADMLLCGAKAVVVGNYDTELEPVIARGGVYLAKGRHAAGVLEGLRRFGAL